MCCHPKTDQSELQHETSATDARRSADESPSSTFGSSRLTPQALAPFVVQQGTRLFMVVSEATAWVLAELQFDHDACMFLEARRVRYQWPREAYGALLSRIAVAEGVDAATIDETTLDFSAWLATHLQLRKSFGRG